MLQLIQKAQQINAVIFNGKFHTNKSVTQGAKKELGPYSNIFYWSHARATGPCEFGLHGHEGFEIMTFIWEGENAHFDTASQKWTPLTKGDFQIIQTGKGLEHAEKLIVGTRSFQIWFDPDFAKSLFKTPSYNDYSISNWEPLEENGFETNYYIGGNSPATCDTEGLVIKKLNGNDKPSYRIELSDDCNYHFYQLNGTSQINQFRLNIDDVLKVSNISEIDLSIDDLGELFVIQTPVNLSYPTIWAQ